MMMEWKIMTTQQQHQQQQDNHHHDHHDDQKKEDEENSIRPSNPKEGLGLMYVKVMTDEQMELLRHQISVYASICEKLADMFNSISSQHDLADMSRAGESSNTPAEYSGHLIPLANLSAVQMRMDSVHRFLSQSIDCNAPVNRHQMESVSSEIATAIQDIIANGTALLAESPDLKPAEPNLQAVKEEEYDVADGEDFEIVELDAVELLAEHFHFCEICGKGFRRDANLRMHMRAHGNQFKTAEALTKPGKTDSTVSDRTIRFSCPHAGCNRNKAHKKFRPLKSAICAKNHFKRSHCPKMYSCNRCEKKRFSVLADLKSHLRSCGTARWRCSCGTTFSRKDKLFGHVALFDGHMPAVVGDDDGGEGRGKSVSTAGDDEEEDLIFRDGEFDPNCEDDGVFEGLLDGFGSIDNFSLHDVLGI